MKYQISWLEEKTISSGAKKYDLTLLAEDGKTIDKVTMWDSFPGFADIKNGQEITGDIVTKQNGQYTNVTIYPIKASTGQTGGFKGNMNKMMEKKAEYIEKAQERKNDSIAFFNATNSAITITKDGAVKTIEDTKEEIRMWRTWFLKEWKDYNDVPF